MDNNARILWEDICCYLYCEVKKSSSRKLIQEIFCKPIYFASAADEYLWRSRA